MMQRLILLITLLVFACDAVAQQVAVVTQAAVLRRGPSTTSKQIATLAAGEVITILRHGKKSGFVRIRTQDEQVGWLAGQSVQLLDPTEVHVPTQPGAIGSAPRVVVDSGAFDSCSVAGNAVQVLVQALNRLKNRSGEPQDVDLDSSVTLTALLAPGDDSHRFNESKAVEIVGYVYRVIPGGRSETANCKKGDPVHRDSHIELTASPTDTDEIRRVIVEVTPRWRAALKQQNIDWSTATLQHTIEGHWVKVRGWLLFDIEHKGEAENTNPGGDRDWRATVWEVHPVSELTIVSEPQR